MASEIQGQAFWLEFAAASLQRYSLPEIWLNHQALWPMPSFQLCSKVLRVYVSLMASFLQQLRSLHPATFEDVSQLLLCALQDPARDQVCAWPDVLALREAS